MSRATILLVAALVSLPLAACTDDPPAATTPAASTCSPPAKSTLTMKNSSNPIAVWETSLGCFAAEIYVHAAPITGGNFVNLTKSTFFDGTRFHRVIANFMIQDGDPLSKDPAKKAQWGTGDPGYEIKDE